MLRIILAILLLSSPVLARDNGQWEAQDPAISNWFKTLMQPDAPTIPCCGTADAYWADEVKVEGDKVYAIITDTRDDAPLKRPHIPVGTAIEIPVNKYVVRKSNPTGHSVLFVGYYGSVFCFVMNGGV